jgi:Secretion system C-terminal sorting domain
MKQYLTFYLLLLLSSPALLAQRPPLAQTDLETPALKARISNSADHLWNFVNRAGLEVPNGSGLHTNFAHSTWIGGTDPGGQLHIAAHTFRQSGIDFFAGPVLPNPADATGKGFDRTVFSYNIRQLLGLKTGKFLLVDRYGLQVYDPSTNIVNNLPLLNSVWNQNAIELADSTVLLAGVTLSNPTNPCYRFHPDQPNAGTYFVDSAVRTFPFMHLLPDGRVLAISLLSQEIFDPQVNQFQPFPINGLQLAGPIYPFKQDTLITFTGGISANGQGTTGITTATQLIHVASQTAVAGPNLLVPRVRPLMLTTPGGEHFVFGGAIKSDTIERYNPLTHTFEYAGRLGVFGLDPQGVVLPDGTFLLNFSGYSDSEKRLVRYDPQTQTSEWLVVVPSEPLIAITPNARVAFATDHNRISLLDLDYRTIQDEPYQYIWRISSAEIAQFRQDYLLGQIDFRRYPDIATWPGNGRTALGEPAQLAPYVDVDLDGVYAPTIGGDYPCIRGDYATWSVYNDVGVHTETGGQALGIEVESMAWAVDCNLRPCPDPDLQYVVFQSLEITNRSALTYHDLYVGGFYDFDLGNYGDDYTGCDTTLGLAFGYNGDPIDDGFNGYGIAPPATGSLILPNADISGMTHFTYHENDFSPRGNPETADDFYGYLQSIWKDGNHVVDDGQDGYAPGGIPVNHMFPGDPGYCGGVPSGWSEQSANNSPYDRRYVQSTGPLTFPAGATLSYDYAVLYGRGTDHLNSVCELKSNAAALLAWWPTLQQAACSSAPLSARDPQAPTLGLSIAPNPANTRADLRLDTPLRARTQLRVCDLAGRVHTQAELPAGTQAHTLDLQELPAGLYLVQLSSAAGSAVQRIAVQH